MCAGVGGGWLSGVCFSAGDAACVVVGEVCGVLCGARGVVACKHSSLRAGSRFACLFFRVCVCVCVCAVCVCLVLLHL